MRVITSLLLLFAEAILLSAYPALLRPSNVLSSLDTEVTLTTPGRKRSAANGLQESYHMRLSVGGNDVTLKLGQKYHRRDVRLYKAGVEGLELLPSNENEHDWALYQGEGDNDAAVLVKRVNDYLTVEGSMSHDGAHYMIQPSNNDKGHVVHRLKINYKQEPNIDKLKRFKRASLSVPYEVEVFMFFDHGIYYRLSQFEDFKNNMDATIKEFYGLLINDMDYRYKSFKKFGIDISIVMGGLSYFKNVTDIPYISTLYPKEMNGTVDSHDLLVAIHHYARNYMADLDAVMIQSGFAFPGGNRGMGFYNGTCRGNAQSVVRNNLDFRAGFISAHELGHNLHIYHDTEKGFSCRNNNVMSAYFSSQHYKEFPLNSWEFSNCSYLQLRDYITYLDKNNINCLLTRTANMTNDLSKYGKKLYGLHLTTDKQCEMMIGPGSKHCVVSVLGCQKGQLR